MSHSNRSGDDDVMNYDLGRRQLWPVRAVLTFLLGRTEEFTKKFRHNGQHLESPEYKPGIY